MNEIFYADLQVAARLIQSRELSSQALTSTMLARIAQQNPHLHAYITVMADSALDYARQMDAEIAQGKVRGPLHGVPIAVKDIFWTTDAPTTAGMGIHQNFIAATDATVIQRLRAAGAVMLGKLTLTEGVYAEHSPPFSAPLNPWGAEYWSGASSSGSAVATAAGLAFATLCSETGGSIKLPCAANGVTGIKPTWGRVSRHGVFELAATLDHVGVMARSVADAATMFAAIAGADPLDPTASQSALPDYVAGLNVGVQGLRIGIDRQWLQDGVDEQILAALNEALAVLCSQGAVLEEVRVPDVSGMIWDWFGVCAVQTALAHKETYPAAKDHYGPALSELLDKGNAMTGLDYQQLLLRREDFRGRLNRLLTEVDVLALPVLAFQTPSIERMENVDHDLIAGLHRFTCPFNMSGHPGIILPCGFTDAGMPIVFQLVGRHFSEDVLFAAGHSYQQATDWHRRRPAAL